MRIPKVMLALDRARVASRGLLRGITKYAHLHGPWRFDVCPPFYRDSQDKQVLAMFRNLTEDHDGIIAYINNSDQIDTLKKTQKPAIVIPMATQVENYPNILSDWEKTGQLAADHFLERGLRHFAFCGLDPFIWATQRGRAFCDYLQRMGHEVHLYQPFTRHRLLSWEQERPRMIRWLRSLPKPVGLFAWNDERGENVIDACLATGIQVPEEVAVLGVDNDDLICDLLDIPLSSMVLNFEQAGYQAAKLLEELMTAKKPSAPHVMVQPTHVVARRSTDILATEDSDIADALRYINNHVAHPLQVGEVIKHMTVSRRTLQKKFRKYLGRSIHDEIIRVRIEKASRMLEETNLSISQIAEALKFSEVTDLSRRFLLTKGITPSAYRSQFCRG